MLRIALLSVTILALTLFGAPGVVGAEGVLEGTVLNKTGGETPVSGQEVELKVLTQDGSISSTAITRTDDAGKFRFSSLATVDDYSYVITTKFQEVEYQAVIQASEVRAPGKAELAVYDSSNDVGVQVDLSHLVVEVDPTTRDLTVLEVAIIQNSSDRTLVAKDPNGKTLWLPLPEGALHPEVIEGLDELNDPNTDIDGLAYSGPVLPGKRQVVYSYMLANPGNNFNLAKQIAYSSRKVNVLMTDVGQRIDGPGLSSQSPVNIKDRNYLFLSGEAFEAGQSLDVNVSNFPPPSSSGQGLSSVNELKWIIPVVMAVGGLALILAYPRFRASREVAARRTSLSHRSDAATMHRR